MSQIPGTNVSAPIVPNDTLDTWPSHIDQYGRGGYRSVATPADRNAIPADRRSAGMAVRVLGIDETGVAGRIYVLGDDLVTWTGQNTDNEINTRLANDEARINTLDNGELVPMPGLVTVPVGPQEPILYTNSTRTGGYLAQGRTLTHAFISGPNGPVFQANVGEKYGTAMLGMGVYAGEIVTDMIFHGVRPEQIYSFSTKSGKTYTNTPAGLVRTDGTAQPWAAYALTSGTTFAAFAAPVSAARLCYLLFTLGQSNGLGQSFVDSAHPDDPAYSCTDTNDPMLDTTPVYPNNAFMLRPGGPQMYGAPSPGLSPLREVRQNTGDSAAIYLGYMAASAASGWANSFIAIHEQALGYRPYCIAAVTCKGSTPYAGLKRGTVPWGWFEQALTDAARLARENGTIPVMPLVRWAGSESDLTQDHTDSAAHITPAQNAAAMSQLQRDLTAAARSFLDPGHPEVILVLTPPALTGEWDAFDQPIAQSYEVLRGHPFIRVENGGYEAVANPFDHVHRLSVGQNRRGQITALTMARELFQIGYADMHPVEWWWTDATHFSVRFNVSVEGESIALDTSQTDITTTSIPGYYGFVFDDGSGSPPAITGHSINIDVVSFTLAAAPTGRRPRYAYATKYQTFDHTGAFDGPRGCLRGTWSMASIYDGHLVYDWVPAHVLNLY